MVTAIVEPSLANAKPDDKFQFERHGYFVADRVDHSAEKPVFNLAVAAAWPHNLNKDFWNRALVVISLTNYMTQTARTVFGMVCHRPGHQGWALQPRKWQHGFLSPAPAPLQTDCHKIHETSATLLATLGQPIFEPLTQNAKMPTTASRNRQSCSIAKPDASGVG